MIKNFFMTSNFIISFLSNYIRKTSGLRCDSISICIKILAFNITVQSTYNSCCCWTSSFPFSIFPFLCNDVTYLKGNLTGNKGKFASCDILRGE